MNSRLSYKSMADYDYHRVLQQKKNLAQVQKVLTIYENNNQSLVDQVYELIKQNQMLRKQANTPKLTKSKLQPYKPNISVQQHNENSQINTTVRSTTKKHNTISSSKIRLNHPRDVYLPAEEAYIMNMKRLRQATTAHKTYDKTREFEEFKEKLSAKKKQLKEEFKEKLSAKKYQLKEEYRKKPTVLDGSNLSLSRKVYLEGSQIETEEFNSRKPLVEVEKVQPVTFNVVPSINYSYGNSKMYKRDNSPYNQFKTQTPIPSQRKSTQDQKQIRKSAQRSSSAIKIEKVYPEYIKIQEPRTKWGDLSSTYYERSKLMQNDENGLGASERIYEKVGGSRTGKNKRKKFLNVISLSLLQEKHQEKSKV